MTRAAKHSKLRFGAAGLLSLAVLLVSTPSSALPREGLWKGREGEAGSGVPRKKAGRGDRDRLRAPERRRPKSSKEEQAITELEAIGQRYRDAVNVAQDTLAQVVLVESAAAKRELTQQFAGEIKTHEVQAEKLRGEAIARYEKFLADRPSNPTWTPEIMLRLAELHFETENQRYAELEEAYNEQIEALKEGEQAPPPPVAEYGRAVDLYRGVATRFPRYAHTDAALYMMGILLYEGEKFDDSRQAFLALACPDRFAIPNPAGDNVTPSSAVRAGDYAGCVPLREGSKYVAEAWLRVGEVHYDMDELDPALEAYLAAASDTSGPLYDEALIRVAWTLYLKRDFAGAVAKLDEFVLFADKAKRTGQKDAQGAATLRDDAVRYIAKCYIEDDWDLDHKPDPVWGLARLDRDYKERTQEPHVPEIYAALGVLFAEDTQFQQAIQIWELALGRWPVSAAAPLLQRKILDAQIALGDKEGARVSREALATNYLRGTKWFYANESDPDALEAAMKLVEEALVATAVEHHAVAQELRQKGDPKAAEEYAQAARAYEAYLQRYPDTPSSYKYRFAYAESLYYSEQWLPAADAYTDVRDSTLGSKYQVDAARGLVLSLEAHIEGEQSSGNFTYPDMPKKGQVQGPFTPQEIPDMVRRMQRAYDKLIALDGKSEELATYRYNAAAISQRYFHFSDAERRFVEIVDRHCDKNVAINAGFAIIDSYVVREDHKATQEWTARLGEKGCGEGELKEKFAGDLKTLGLAARFQEANLLLEAGEYEAAADRYVALVEEEPKDKNADRALNNAAVAYEKIGRFGSAGKTYQRIYNEYPDSEFADDALLRSGLNHVRFFEFEDAVTTYLKLAEDERYKDSEHRLLALKNAADLLDSLQQYNRSAAMYQKYANKVEDPAEVADAAFRRAKVLRKTGDYKAIEAAYGGFISKYGGNESQADKVVEGYLRIGQSRAARGDRKGAESAYRDCIATFSARKLKNGSDAADFPSEAQFLLSEYALADLLEFELKGRGKALAKSAMKLFDQVVEASKAYDSVIPYRRLEWVLAAMYRRGYAFETTAIKMRKAPVPRSLKPYTEVWFAYKEEVEKGAARFESMAIPLYEETIKRAKQYGVANEWTRKALERLNVYKPAEYPLLREPAVELQVEDRR